MRTCARAHTYMRGIYYYLVGIVGIVGIESDIRLSEQGDSQFPHY